MKLHHNCYSILFHSKPQRNKTCIRHKQQTIILSCSYPHEVSCDMDNLGKIATTERLSSSLCRKHIRTNKNPTSYYKHISSFFTSTSFRFTGLVLG
jgi:hypothetical protein